MKVPMKYHHPSHKHKTVDWKNWRHRKESKAVETTFEELLEKELAHD